MRLREVKGLGDAAITELKIVQAAASRLARGQVKARTVLSSWSSVLDYCRTAMAFAGISKASERADLLAYLNTLSDNPQPLPKAEPAAKPVEAKVAD